VSERTAESERIMGSGKIAELGSTTSPGFHLKETLHESLRATRGTVTEFIELPLTLGEWGQPMTGASLPP
jgi:hypothetical protein